MRKYFPLLLSSMLACALLVEGTGCSSMSQTTVPNATPVQSVEEELTSNVASSNDPASESDTASGNGSASKNDTTSINNTASGDNSHPGNTVDPDNATASDKVADASEMVDVVDVVDPGMVPVHADALLDGIYPIKMRSSSSMFKADHVCLEVKDGQMQAYLFMTSQSYAYMFAGTAQDAADADEARYIPLEKTDVEGEELEAFLLPVDSLDEGLSFSSYSRRKEKWYDRTLLFEASSLPVNAFKNPPFTQVSVLNLKDGEYLVDVKLDGGSGRANVVSPAKLTISDGKAVAHIVWSSNNYDFMLVDGEKYMPVDDESGNSAFDIPVAFFDYKLPVQADTTAMSQPHLIDYTLVFDSSSIVETN